MKKLYTILLVALGAVLLATYGVLTVDANTNGASNSTVSRVQNDAYYTNSIKTSNTRTTLSVLRFGGAADSRMTVADLFVGNGNADVSDTLAYTVQGNKLVVTDKPAGVSEYYVQIQDGGKSVKVVETKDGVTRTRVGHSTKTVQSQQNQND